MLLTDDIAHGLVDSSASVVWGVDEAVLDHNNWNECRVEYWVVELHARRSLVFRQSDSSNVDCSYHNGRRASSVGPNIRKFGKGIL